VVFPEFVVDAHCHIDQFPNPERIARDTEAAAIDAVAVTNTPSHYELGKPHLSHFRHVRLALGLHPLATNAQKRELPLFLSLVESAAFVGEIGLDFSAEGRATMELQVQTFRKIAEALHQRKRFITIHSRRAETTALEILSEFDVGPVVFHWFTGSRSVLIKIVEAGHYFSVNPAMTRSKSGRLLVGEVPADRLLTETDGPHVKVSGKPADPRCVNEVVDWFSKNWRVASSEAERLIQRNFDVLTQRLGHLG